MSDGMMSNLERLVYMANQIARNFEAIGADVATAATADHMLAFWDPRMKAQIVECKVANPDTFTPVAAAAVEMLARGLSPAAQSRATVFNAVDEAGRGDAG
jgi:formate dehydrogenase subunit delta